MQGIMFGIAGIALSMLISFALSLVGLLDTAPVLDKISRLPPLVAIAAFTLAPLSEELLFRGLLLRSVSDSLGKAAGGKFARFAWLAAVFLTSLLFALFHLSYGSFAELLVAFSLGALFCLSVKKSGSLIPAIIAHAIFNFASIAIMVLT
ncbi:MAG: CPBP family intramembrane metalloprotease [Candidatus Micrarchaeota archaeon]|nr:CPBP family intramembrane metalloprotease [Candidatus Micrarchaeota archaeon]